eukprot:CAMPEP_0184380800 /NCGR_PEP_ID=MMETSP0007-20130409/5062_1 /TAXON_ID=97485 /ORGANISM="Prymnesium parvum, Strain Texoma1" /LENGTH=66 /DNA_ID=CAMNT_0026726191 /DNA_START=210 /DNA_END=407 /DNA_ORIENTATION=+
MRDVAQQPFSHRVSYRRRVQLLDRKERAGDCFLREQHAVQVVDLVLEHTRGEPAQAALRRAAGGSF